MSACRIAPDKPGTAPAATWPATQLLNERCIQGRDIASINLLINEIMVRITLMILSLLTFACHADSQNAAQQVKSFYNWYLKAWVADQTPDLNSPEMQRYVAKKTLTALERKQNQPDNNPESDYFTFTQDLFFAKTSVFWLFHGYYIDFRDVFHFLQLT